MSRSRRQIIDSDDEVEIINRSNSRSHKQSNDASSNRPAHQSSNLSSYQPINVGNSQSNNQSNIQSIGQSNNQSIESDSELLMDESESELESLDWSDDDTLINYLQSSDPKWTAKKSFKFDFKTIKRLTQSDNQSRDDDMNDERSKDQLPDYVDQKDDDSDDDQTMSRSVSRTSSRTVRPSLRQRVSRSSVSSSLSRRSHSSIARSPERSVSRSASRSPKRTTRKRSSNEHDRRLSHDIADHDMVHVDQSVEQSINHSITRSTQLLVRIDKAPSAFNLSINRSIDHSVSLFDCSIDELMLSLKDVIQRDTGITVNQIGQLINQSNHQFINRTFEQCGQSLRTLLNDRIFHPSVNPSLLIKGIVFNDMSLVNQLADRSPVQAILDCYNRIVELNPRACRSHEIAQMLEPVIHTRKISINQSNNQSIDQSLCVHHLLPLFASLRFEPGIVEEICIGDVESRHQSVNRSIINQSINHVALHSNDVSDGFAEIECLELLAQAILDTQLVTPSLQLALDRYPSLSCQVSLPIHHAINQLINQSNPFSRLTNVSFRGCFMVPSESWPRLIVCLSIVPSISCLDLFDTSIDQATIPALTILIAQSKNRTRNQSNNQTINQSNNLSTLLIGRSLIGGINITSSEDQSNFDQLIDCLSDCSLDSIDVSGHQWTINQTIKLINSFNQSKSVRTINLSNITCTMNPFISQSINQSMDAATYFTHILPQIFEIYVALGDLLKNKLFSCSSINQSNVTLDLAIDGWYDYAGLLSGVITHVIDQLINQTINSSLDSIRAISWKYASMSSATFNGVKQAIARAVVDGDMPITVDIDVVVQ